MNGDLMGVQSSAKLLQPQMLFRDFKGSRNNRTDRQAVHEGWMKLVHFQGTWSSAAKQSPCIGLGCPRSPLTSPLGPYKPWLGKGREMAKRHRALVAAQPAAWGVLSAMLHEVIDLVPAHTMAEAFRVLERDAADIELIISTIAFDESRMIEFLQAVKRHPTLNRIPFLCMRVLPSVLSDDLVGRMRDVCTQCEAVDLLDLAHLPPETAQ